jgi:hypothetical protein
MIRIVPYTLTRLTSRCIWKQWPPWELNNCHAKEGGNCRFYVTLRFAALFNKTVTGHDLEPDSYSSVVIEHKYSTLWLQNPTAGTYPERTTQTQPLKDPNGSTPLTENSILRQFTVAHPKPNSVRSRHSYVLSRLLKCFPVIIQCTLLVSTSWLHT